MEGSINMLHSHKKSWHIYIVFCTCPADRLLCYWLAACLWPGSCPRFSWEVDFISSLINFLEPAKTRGWALFLDPCNLSIERLHGSENRAQPLVYRRYSVDNRLDALTTGMLRKTDKKHTESQLPSLEHLLEKPGLSYHGAWKLQKHCWTSPTLLKTNYNSRPHCNWMLATACCQETFGTHKN